MPVLPQPTSWCGHQWWCCTTTWKREIRIYLASTNLFERKKLRWADDCVRPEPVRRSCCNSLLSPLRQDLLPWPNARDLKAAGKNRLGQLHSTEEHQLLEALKSSRSRSNGPTDIISCQAATRNEGNVWAGSHGEGAYCILRKYGITGEKTK